MTRTKYLVAGILVEAVQSPLGSFYEVTVVGTGEKKRYLADYFELVAEEACGLCGHSMKDNSHGPDQNDFETDGDQAIHVGQCTYCKHC